MADLDKLEQLNRLKDAGALTEAEFDEQKRQILSVATTPLTKPIWISSLLLVLIVCAVWLSTRLSEEPDFKSDHENSEISAKNSLNISTDNADDTAETPMAKLALEPKSDFEFATSEEVVGLSAAYLEQRLGFPIDKSDGSLIFQLGNCRISYFFDGGGVTGFYIGVTNTCHPIIRGRPIGRHTRFGSLIDEDNSGKFFAACLSCGSQTEPSVALNYRSITRKPPVTIAYASDFDKSGGALRLWLQTIRNKLRSGNTGEAKGEMSYYCTQNPPAEVDTMLRQIPVTGVWMRTGDNAADC